MKFGGIFDRKKPRDVSCMFRGGTSNLQGGAIYAKSATLTISNTEFISNTAQSYVSEILSVCCRKETS